MRTTLLAFALVSGLGVYVYAQSAANPRVSLSFTANSISVRPASGYDGIVREGKADNILTARGNVVIVINDIRLTTETAVWHWDATRIELAGGTASIDLPGAPTSIRYEVRR